MEIDIPSLVNSSYTIVSSVIGIFGFLYGGYRWIMKPINKITQLISDNNAMLGVNSEKLNKALQLIDNQIKPFMDSIQKEFSPNSGKTLKDQLIRIEDSIAMNDIRIRKFTMNCHLRGIYECDEFGRCLWVNDTLADMWGKDKSEMYGSGWLSCIATEERENVWERWQFAVKNGTPYEDIYTVKNARTGEVFKVKTSTNFYRKTSEKSIIFFGIVEKIESKS